MLPTTNIFHSQNKRVPPPAGNPVVYPARTPRAAIPKQLPKKSLTKLLGPAVDPAGPARRGGGGDTLKRKIICWIFGFLIWNILIFKYFLFTIEQFCFWNIEDMNKKYTDTPFLG